MNCPNCGVTVTRRSSGACPHCQTPIESYKGIWYRTGEGTPPVQLLHRFERNVSQRMSAVASKRINFVIPVKAARYRRELVQAERLLDLAEFDLDLALAALDVLFEHSRFRRKSYTTLLWLEDDYLVALALARTYINEERTRIMLETTAASQAIKKEDIFA